MKERRSNSYSICENPTTTTCISWQGGDIPCLNICNGDTLTYVETQFANAICALNEEVDLSSIIIPDCLKAAWGTKDPSILNFITLLLQETCSLQTQVNSINENLATFNPLVTVDYKCCADNPCITTGTVRLSVALENIINCLCAQKQLIDSQAATIESLNDSVTSLSTKVQNFETQLSNLTVAMSTLSSLVTNTYRTKINCVISATGVSGSCSPL